MNTSEQNNSHNNHTGQGKAYTPKKGKATPKRKEAHNSIGSFESRFAPAESYSEARKRRKELKASMSAEEWKEYKNKEKEARRQRQHQTQAAMDRGEEQYLLPRDKGVERRFVRDLVDSKRYLNNWVMPFAIVLLILLLIGQANTAFGNIVSLIAMVVMLVFFLEAIILGRSCSKAVREKFPTTTERGFSIGFYAYGRATQPRRWRTPKPRVEIGDKVA
ncbi:hypothetical membrane protein [Corynebacterium kutscheri]|uniref:Hypothetical membrane protein n=1 Tax=Corynebacterium kutscheri TaxID=35755 RepID=A0AB38VVB8_9CORY|nr:DUF3043 domain-containing protein [Corynebacterium kutscheri]VEH08879.1 hypothetical membrane protein [Corynebacterium kutscheri]VEH80008.1 hypothetical membrane protein [Corynebacterium kutscheri]